MQDSIAIEQSRRGSVEVLKVCGFMNLLQVPVFEAHLDRLIQAGQVRLVLDFTDLEYIASAGLGAIIGRTNEIRSKHGDIKVGGCSRTVANIMAVFGFSTVFTVVKTPEEAVRLFSEKS